MEKWQKKSKSLEMRSHVFPKDLAVTQLRLKRLIAATSHTRSPWLVITNIDNGDLRIHQA